MIGMAGEPHTVYKQTDYCSAIEDNRNIPGLWTNYPNRKSVATSCPPYGSNHNDQHIGTKNGLDLQRPSPVVILRENRDMRVGGT